MCNYLQLVSVLTVFSVCSGYHCPPPATLFINGRVVDFSCPSGYNVIKNTTTGWCVPALPDCSNDLEDPPFNSTCRCNNQTTVVGGRGEIDCADVRRKSNLCCSINDCAANECCAVSAPGKAVGVCRRLGSTNERCNIFMSSDKRNVGFCDCFAPLKCRYNLADDATGICSP